MKRIIVLLIAFATFSCTSNAQKTKFSKEALSETLLAIDGSQVAFKDILKKHKGKTLVIEVWASWCGDCIKAMPKLKELQANNPDVAYVFISMDKTADKWKVGIEKYELKGDNFMANDQMKGVFAKAIDINKSHRGDLIALRSAGAYGEIMASQYNCRKLPIGYITEDL